MNNFRFITFSKLQTNGYFRLIVEVLFTKTPLTRQKYRVQRYNDRLTALGLRTTAEMILL